MKKIFIITNANRKIGLGHLQRQSSLIEYLYKKKIKTFLFVNPNNNLQKINNKKFEYIKNLKRKTILKYIKFNKPEYIIIDVFQKNFDNFIYLAKNNQIIQIVSDIGHTYKKFANKIIKFGKNINKKKIIIKKKIYRIFRKRFHMV